jgi:hypothetical protein
MFECELIAGSGSSAVSLDLYDDLPLSLNLNIADIKEPDKRNGDYSKTIKLKGTGTNNKFFEETYDVNIVTNTWNPNLKTPAYFLKQGTKPMVGDLRLMSIDIIRKNEFEDITYNVVLMGRNTNIFVTIGDAKLEDLDLSTYNHNYTLATQQSAENNQIYVSSVLTTVANGVGYRYPVVDYGNAGNFNANYYKVDWLRPAIFAKTYWDKIFADAGKTYTSTFLNDVNDLFCKELILHNGDKLLMSAATQALQEFKAGMTATSAAQNFPLYDYAINNYSTINTISSAFLWNNLTEPKTYCKFDDDTTLPFIDTGAMYDTTTGIWVVQNTGTYSLLGDVNIEVKINLPGGVTSSTNSFVGYAVKVARSTNSGATWLMQQYDYFNNSTVLTTSYKTINHTIAGTGSMTLNQGDWLRVEIHPLVSWGANGLQFFNGATPVLSAAGGSLDYKLLSTSNINFKFVSAQLQEGSSLAINDAIPKEIKQRDFLLSMVKKFNLYIDEDKANPNNYIIEPRDAFYAAGTTLDWSAKYAADKETHIEPMGAINVKTFYWKYKDDQDYYNKQYQDAYQEAYGTKTKIITNDFLKSDLKNEVIFSPTPVVDNINNEMIIPMIFQYDGTNVKPLKHNIRCVLWRGSVTVTNNWTLGSITGNVSKNSYAAVAMSDNPLAATKTIEFGVPNELYYDGIGPTYTTNNLYNRFYSRQIEEITDRDSKIVTMYLYLEPQDISKFDFRNKVYIDKTYYYVNKIMDYNPLKNQLTKVELLKVKLGNTYVPVSEIELPDIETNRLTTGLTTRAYGGNPNSTIVGEAGNLMAGENISSRMSGGVMSGKNIGVGNSCYLITVISSENVNIANNASGITLRNSSGINVGASSNRIDLTNCSNVTIDELVYNYVGVGLSNVTVTTADNGTYRNDNELSGSLVGLPYTPTLTNVTNVSASTAYPTQYSRVGRIVTVSGQVDIEPTGAGAFEVGISLPVTSDIQQVWSCTGTCTSSDITDSPCYIKGDVANNRASLNGTAVNITNHLFYYVFTYRII